MSRAIIGYSANHLWHRQQTLLPVATARNPITLDLTDKAGNLASLSMDDRLFSNFSYAAVAKPNAVH
jgi:hypothetical protein